MQPPKGFLYDFFVEYDFKARNSSLLLLLLLILLLLLLLLLVVVVVVVVMVAGLSGVQFGL